MSETFTSLLNGLAGDVGVALIALRLALAIVAGCVVAWLASGRQNNLSDDTLPITLVLMSVLIAMATQIIGDNIARAFSLVGALSIVRFRTAVPQTQDVAFVLTSVVVGMAIGAGQFLIATIGLVMVSAIVQFIHYFPRAFTGESREPTPPAGAVAKTIDLALVVGPSAAEAVQITIGQMCRSFQLRCVETARKGAALKLHYEVILATHTDATSAVIKLQQLSAVESVELKMR